MDRPRPPAAAPLSAAPNLLLLGCPYVHAEYIGALIAEALGYGYLDVRYSVPMPLDLAPDDAAVTAARIQLVRSLTADDAATRKHVWSVADHRVLPAMADRLAEADVACVIYVRSGDRLLARGGEIWNIPLAEMLRLRATLDRLVETAPWSVLTLSLPDELLVAAAGRFTLCAQDERPPYKYVTVEGPAVIGDLTEAERVELARRYLGTEGGDAYIAANPGDGQVMIRMTPERWLSVDYGQG